MRSLHWTGHYIDDPTLAFATSRGFNIPRRFVRALISPVILVVWDMAAFQSLGIAKVWSGKARLPSAERMWKEYPGAGNDFFYFPGLTQCKQS